MQVYTEEEVGKMVRLQARYRGRTLRRLIRTTKIQQILETLNEIDKMARRFRQDIVKENQLTKGDRSFHQSLVSQVNMYAAAFFKSWLFTMTSKHAVHRLRSLCSFKHIIVQF